MTYIETKKAEAKAEIMRELGKFRPITSGATNNLLWTVDTLIDELLNEIESRVVPEERLFSCGDCASANYCDCFDKSNEQAIWRNEIKQAFQHLRTGVETEV